MDLYKILKNRDLVLNEKEYTYLIYNRQIKVNNERIADPHIRLASSKNYHISIGLKEIKI